MVVSGGINKPMDFSETQVLVVDDEVFMRGLIRRYLETIGLTKISEATDGVDGLTKLNAAQPDLIILDIMMKPMNGLKFLKAVRTGASSARREVPVIVVTGSDEQAVLGTAMTLDCNAFVRKSEGLDMLKDRIARVLEETLEIKEEAVYRSVEVPDITITVPPAPPPLPAFTPTKAYEVPIEEVEVGAVVARDVMTEEGSFLLMAGSVLSASYLNRLKDISEIIDLPSIWVEK